MRNAALKVVVKAVANRLASCAKTTYLYTQNLSRWQAVHKARALYMGYSGVVLCLSHKLKLAFPSVNIVFLPIFHTTYKDHKKLINLFSY